MKCEFPKKKWKLLQNEKLAFGLQIILFLKLLHTCTCVALHFRNVMVQNHSKLTPYVTLMNFPKNSNFVFTSNDVTFHITHVVFHITIFFFNFFSHVTYFTLNCNVK